jgi:hypothetical protein
LEEKTITIIVASVDLLSESKLKYKDF